MSGKQAKKNDISDLKARLGLKQTTKKTTGTGAAVPAPPGVRPSAGVRPPPGAVAPTPQVPDARHDPFGAMSAIAQQPQQQAAAPIVIIDDGKGERVNKGGKSALVKITGVAIVAVVLGYVIGGISYKNGEYNATIDEAKFLTDAIKEAGRPLESLSNTLLMARERGQGQNSFIPHDVELTKELAALELPKPNREVLLTSRLLNMNPTLIEDTIMFYSDLTALYDLVGAHVRFAEAEQKALKGKDPVAKQFGGTAFGVIFPKTADKQPVMAQLVQVGMPVCADNKPNPQGCGGTPTGFQYRPDVTQPSWGSKKFVPSSVAQDQIFFLQPSTVWTAFQRGSERFYAEVAYIDRIERIEELARALAERRKKVENRLNQKAQEAKSFSL